MPFLRRSQALGKCTSLHIACSWAEIASIEVLFAVRGMMFLMHPRRGRRAGTTLAVVMGLVSSACYFATDFDAFSTSANDAAEGGASDMQRDAAAPPDALVASPNDANLASDGAFVCGMGQFCDDFERVTASNVAGLWDGVSMFNASTVEITSHAKTGAGALRINVSAQMGSSGDVHRNVAKVGKMVLDYALFLDVLPGRNVNLPGLSFSTNNGTHTVAVFLLCTGSNIAVAEQEYDMGMAQYFKANGKISIGTSRWVDVHMELDFSNAPATANVTYDGKPVMNAPLARVYPKVDGVVTMGAPFASTGSALSVDFDDVALTITPP